jgi:hypothetical protein
MTVTPPDFEAIEAHLWSILEPYRGRLEAGSIYGLATLKWVGTKQHDFFAGVRVAPNHVAFHLMPVYTDPHLLDDVSPGLRKHLKGKTTFNFTSVDEALFAELADLTERSFEAYAAAHQSAP